MRRLMMTVARGLPLVLCAMAGGCNVTSRQLQDFAASTAVRVLTTTGANVFESWIVSTFGGA